MPDKISTFSTRICKHCRKTFHYHGIGFLRFCSRDCWANERIWKFINKTESCWLWTGSVGDTGYALCARRKGVTAMVHRHVWEILVGEIPKEMELCHNCPGGDNRLCVNPAHHFLGTHEDNVADCVAKGRNVKGEKVPLSKLKEFQILEIREILQAGNLPQREIANIYGVSQSVISTIFCGKAWKHV